MFFCRHRIALHRQRCRRFVAAPASLAVARSAEGRKYCREQDPKRRARQATSSPKRRHRVEWAQVLSRVFQVDVTCCPACGGPMKIIAAITAPASIRKVLDALGLPSRAPPIAAATSQQLELDAA